MDLLRFLAVRWMLRFARRLLATYIDRHHPSVRHWATMATGAIDIALAGVETALTARLQAIRHPVSARHDESELGSDDQLTPPQKERIAAQLAADRTRVRAEDQRTAAQPVEDDGVSHHRGGAQ